MIANLFNDGEAIKYKKYYRKPEFAPIILNYFLYILQIVLQLYFIEAELLLRPCLTELNLNPNREPITLYSLYRLKTQLKARHFDSCCEEGCIFSNIF